jgi:hypothetical protein
MLESVIAGRVVPMFTSNAVRGVQQWRNEQVDALALAATTSALLLVLGDASAGLTAGTCAVAAALQFGRLAGWNPWATRHNPLLWILHLSYAWIPLGLVLLAVGALGMLPVSAGLHALTLGSRGGLIIGMMTRTALGHTGRPARGRAPGNGHVRPRATGRRPAPRTGARGGATLARPHGRILDRLVGGLRALPDQVRSDASRAACGRSAGLSRQGGSANTVGPGKKNRGSHTFTWTAPVRLPARREPYLAHSSAWLAVRFIRSAGASLQALPSWAA